MATSKTTMTASRAKRVLQLASQLLEGRCAGEDVTAKKRGMTRRPKRRPIPRPKFKPLWTEQEAIAEANANLAPDHIASIGLRLVAITLSRTPEELMRGALTEDVDGKSPAEAMVKLFEEVEGHLKARMEMLTAARARVLLTACYVHGVEA